MDLFEYQAAALFASFDIPTTRGEVATTATRAREIATALLADGAPGVVVKAQVKVGGRGKAGGVKLARSAAEAADHAAEILGLKIAGHLTEAVYIVAAVDIAAEYYLSFLIDRTGRRYSALCSAAGGVEIETVAAADPDALARIPIDPTTGLGETQIQALLHRAHIPAEHHAAATAVIAALYTAFVQSDATLVEVNPLVATTAGQIMALDAKVTLDAHAAFRHPKWVEYATADAADQRERTAAELGLNYVRLTGEVGIIGNGAGLVMSTLDIVAYAGQSLAQRRDTTPIRPANFLDIGGGASAEVMAHALDIVLDDPQVTTVFVNIFGGITACDQVAHGIVDALEILGRRATKPLVVRLDGNNVEAGRDILAEAAHPMVRMVDSMDAGATLAAALAAGV